VWTWFVTGHALDDGWPRTITKERVRAFEHKVRAALGIDDVVEVSLCAYFSSAGWISSDGDRAGRPAANTPSLNSNGYCIRLRIGSNVAWDTTRWSEPMSEPTVFSFHSGMKKDGFGAPKGVDATRHPIFSCRNIGWDFERAPFPHFPPATCSGSEGNDADPVGNMEDLRSVLLAAEAARASRASREPTDSFADLYSKQCEIAASVKTTGRRAVDADGYPKALQSSCTCLAPTCIECSKRKRWTSMSEKEREWWWKQHERKRAETDRACLVKVEIAQQWRSVGGERSHPRALDL
jgi:hypothetical protein